MIFWLAIFIGGAALTWLTPRFGIFAVLTFLPAYLFRFSVNGLPTTALEALLLGVLLAWFIQRRALMREHFFTLPREWRIALGMFGVAAVIGVFVAPDTRAALGIFKAYYLEPLLFFFMIASELRGLDDARTMLKVLCFPALIVSLWTISQRFGWLAIPAAWQDELRATGPYPFPNAVGLFLAPIIASCAASLTLDWRERRAKLLADRTNWLYLKTIIFSLAAIFLAGSEAALLALATVGMGAGFLCRATRKTTLVIFALGLFVLALLPQGETIIKKITLQDFSGAVHRTVWNESLYLLQDHWLLGAGLSGYPTRLAPYHFSAEIEIFQYPHNIILNIWSELGALGLFALYLIISAAYQSAKKIGAEHWLASIPLLVMIIHGLFDVPFFKNDLALLTMALLSIYLGLQTENR